MGGQAVMEGVMMRGLESYAVAVRRPDGQVVVKVEEKARFSDRHRWARLPLLRGVISLGESMKLGMGALSWSANQALPEEEQQIGKGQMGLSMAVALVVFLGIFIALPVVFARFLDRGVRSTIVSNLIEGAFRLALFLGYLLLIGRIAEIRRLFQYHGAEHKAIAAYEAGDVLTAEAADRYSTRHVRCGTNFLLIVMVLTIVTYTFFGRPSLWWRIGSRVLVIPLVAGLSFELIRLAARRMRYPVVRWAMAPGLALQAVTTKPPTPDQLEVAVASLRAVMTDAQLAEVEMRVDAGAPPMRWVGAAIPA
jgi:uncharacterized protein YqhQ